MTDKPISSVDLRAAYRAQQAEIDAAVRRVLDSGWYISGQECRAFERDFAAWCGAAHAVGVGNGTDAIVIALRSLDVGKSDAVFTVSHTAVATVAAIEMAGAIPVLVDIDPASFTLDPQKLEDAVRAFSRSGSAGRPRAVIAVHLYGQPCDMAAIADICKRHGLLLIEDCAQAHGAKISGTAVGKFGDMASFSFYPTKNLGGFGDGGAVITDDPALAERAAALRQYGWKERYLSDLRGMNTRLDEIQAAILRVRLARLDVENARRREIAGRYNAGLSATITLPIPRPDTLHAYHLYVVRHANRDDLAATLKSAGIGSAIHYPMPVHRQKAYAGSIAVAPSGLEKTDQAAREILSLPLHPFLDDDDADRVVTSVNAWADRQAQ